MPDYGDLERAVSDYYRRLYLMRSREGAQKRIYRLMVEHKYGPGARDPHLPVDWRGMFSENKCPECRDIISLKESSYACGKCGLTIPLDLFDKAAQERKAQDAIIEEGRAILPRARQAGFDGAKISLLMEAGEETAAEELDAQERRRQQEEADRKAGGKGAGAVLGRRRGDEAK
jgi:hypothetical protein